MPGRRQKVRRVGMVPEYVRFDPEGVSCDEEVTLALDELEVIRLVDFERLDQREAALRMGVARTTVTGIYEDARSKVADALVNGKRLLVAGGNVVLCATGEEGRRAWPPRKGEAGMRIAVTYDDGKVYQHFGRTEQFKVYDVADGKVASSQVMGANGVSHGALAGLLGKGGVDVLICGGIGGGAQEALARSGISVFPGVDGDADEAVDAYLGGRLSQADAATCAGHSHGCGHGHAHDHDHGHGHGHGRGHGCGCGND